MFSTDITGMIGLSAHNLRIPEPLSDNDQGTPAGNLAAHMLGKAFENFIRRIITTPAPGLDGNRAAEAGELLTALQTFVIEVIQPLLPVQKNEGNPDEYSLREDQSPKEGSTKTEDIMDNMTAVAKYQVPLSTSPLLQRALDETRSFIFNKMPIRLLAFNTDGSGIRLIERGEIWSHVSEAMALEFDEDTIEFAIMQRHGYLRYGIASWTRATTSEISEFSERHRRFAILSHTWLQGTPGEVIYDDWRSQKYDKNAAGYHKIMNFCRVAATEYGLTLGWMDTVCINKESSSELDESIRSMYKWYQSSAICITYLAGTAELPDMHADPWFTRGWTLQELLAPKVMAFYAADWQKLVPGMEDDKKAPKIIEGIFNATSITRGELFDPLDRIPISRRMQWAANRRVTREEDTAYSLMGIFNVSMSTAYGEGAERAFVRLVREIMTSTGRMPYLLDIANHGYGPGGDRRSTSTTRASYLIPSSPRQYLWRADSNTIWQKTWLPRIPITLTQYGLQVRVLLMPAITVDPSQASGLGPTPFVPQGNYFATANIEVHDYYHAIRGTEILEYDPGGQFCYNILDKAIFDHSDGRTVTLLAVLNCSETSTAVTFAAGGVCFAVMSGLWGTPQEDILPQDGVIWHPLETTHAITFRLQQVPVMDNLGRDTVGSRMNIKKSELEKHGMYLRTLYI